MPANQRRQLRHDSLHFDRESFRRDQRIGDGRCAGDRFGTNPANAVDFQGKVLPSERLTFIAGETLKVITVNVAGDTVLETDEAFTVALSNASWRR